VGVVDLGTILGEGQRMKVVDLRLEVYWVLF
jgi:hypothetical protein